MIEADRDYPPGEDQDNLTEEDCRIIDATISAIQVAKGAKPKKDAPDDLRYRLGSPSWEELKFARKYEGTWLMPLKSGGGTKVADVRLPDGREVDVKHQSQLALSPDDLDCALYFPQFQIFIPAGWKRTLFEAGIPTRPYREIFGNGRGNPTWSAAEHFDLLKGERWV